MRAKKSLGRLKPPSKIPKFPPLAIFAEYEISKKKFKTLTSFFIVVINFFTFTDLPPPLVERFHF